MTFLLIAGFPDSILHFRGALIEALQARGQQVHVAAPGLGPDSAVRGQLQARGVTAHDIPLRRTGMNPLADLLCLASLWRLMRRIRPDYAMGYTIKPVIYGTLAAWLARVPRRFALITGLGYAFQAGGGERRLLRGIAQRLYALGLRRAHKTFFQNPDDLELFRSLGILGPAAPSCVVNGSGVDVAHYRPAPAPPQPRFLMIARLLGDKGVREYAQAAALLRADCPQAVFSLAGWLDDNPDAIAAAELEGWTASGDIDFLGRLADVRPAIEACSVYVLPSYREGTPRTVLEAMAMGRAVVTTDAPGCRQTVAEGENGYLVPVKSARALADAMRRFIDDPGLAPRMGARSRRMAEDRYDVGKVNAAMLAEMDIA